MEPTESCSEATVIPAFFPYDKKLRVIFIEQNKPVKLTSAIKRYI